MAMNKQKKEVKQVAPAEKSGQGTLLIMFAMMMAVFLAGAGMVIGYFKFLDPQGREARMHESLAQQSDLSTIQLEDLLINLAGSDGHYLNTSITIEYPKDKQMEKIVQGKKHHITETVLLTLRQKTIEEVRPTEATDKLKEELIAAINVRLNEEVITKLYFTKYIVQ